MDLFLVVVLVVVTVLAAPAAPATTPLFRFLRRLDGVRQLLQGQADAPLVGVHTNDQQRQLVADELVSVGDELTLLVIRVDANERRIGLSLKELAHAIEPPKETEDRKSVV